MSYGSKIAFFFIAPSTTRENRSLAYQVVETESAKSGLFTHSSYALQIDRQTESDRNSAAFTRNAR